MEGQPRLFVVPMPARQDASNLNPLEPPADLPGDAHEHWRAWAPQALAEGTLTSSTAAGFGELCRLLAILSALDARIAILGKSSTEALPYLRERARHAAQANGLKKDFRLAAVGKPVAGPAKSKSNPWDAFAPTKNQPGVA